jgi:UPF0755 protein
LRVFITLLLVLLIAAAAVAGYLWYAVEKPFGTIPTEGVYVEIPHGASRRAAAHILAKEGVIRSAIAFEIYARRHPRRTLQAGEYFFDHSLTGKEVFWKLANGETYHLPFTVREGETMFDVARELELAKYMKVSEFLRAANDASQIQDIAPGAHTLEGFLFPATYNLPRHAPATELTAMMVRKFREALERVAPALPGEDVVASSRPGPVLRLAILASLVERETPKPEERPIVASVYSNRLQKDMLLQCDPTVIYALDMADLYNGSLTFKDLRYDSPYNTYLHRGLPPGPIGNPGEASLRAASHPAESDYLYFVANTQGGHFFAATLTEHNKNVAKYHRLLNGEPAEPPVSNVSHSNSAGKTHKGKR